MNSVFKGGHPTWANACVGENGFPGYREYYEGFSSAARLLIEQCVSRRGASFPVDIFIYPICFNMRHSIELRFKFFIEQVLRLSAIKGYDRTFDLKRSHDIGNIYSFLRNTSIEFDQRLLELFTDIDPLIEGFSDIDPTGQTFRYPVDNEGRKHLVENPIINIKRLGSIFEYLDNKLGEVDKLFEYLLSEYSQGSYTKRLSRIQLIEIAEELPIKSEWVGESFRNTKKELRVKYGISGRELSKAIKIIVLNYEMAPKIGLNLELLGVSLHEIFQFFDAWIKLHSDFLGVPKATCIEMGGEVLFEEMVAYNSLENECLSDILKFIDVRQLSGLIALFEFHRFVDFSENYRVIYERSLENLTLTCTSSDQMMRKEVDYLLSKTNALPAIIKSLFFLHKNDFASALVDRYEVSDQIPWLASARDRSIFS